MAGMNNRLVAGIGCLAGAALLLYTALGMFVPWSIWDGATSDVAALIVTPFLALVAGALIASGLAPRQPSSARALAVAVASPVTGVLVLYVPLALDGLVKPPSFLLAFALAPVAGVAVHVIGRRRS